MTRSVAAGILLGVAVGVGLGLDTLGRVAPLHLNVALMMATLVLALAALEYGGVISWPRADGRFLGPPLVLFTVLLLWRDSDALFALNVLACLLLLGLASPLGRRPLLRAGTLNYIARPIKVFFTTLIGFVPLAAIVTWRGVSHARWRPVLVGGAGVVAVSPALVIFTLLFSSADPLFGQLASSLFSPDLAALFEAVVPRALWIWAAGGLLWALAGLNGPMALRASSGGRADPLVPSAALTALAVLFMLFLGLQARWLFGGSAVVASTSDLTLAEYVRRGFFELIAVAALTLPILLLAMWAARRKPDGERKVGRVAAVVLILLVALLVSAASRMVLYTREFGLTELRLYATAFMGWLGLTLGWLAATVLRGRPARFASGSLILGLGTLLTLNLMDPDALIARVNLAQAHDGRPLDMNYLEGLGVGATSYVVSEWDQVPASDRCGLAIRLTGRWTTEEQQRIWSLQRRAFASEGFRNLMRHDAACRIR